MCYTGECRFEFSDGECMIYNRREFYEEYGETSCIVGGYIDSYEAEEYYADHEVKLDAIYKQWRMNNRL